MTYLITKADIATYLQLPGTNGAGMEDKRIQRAIKEAQEFDLLEAIGYALYYDLLSNYTSSGVKVLIENKTGPDYEVGEQIELKREGGTNEVTGVLVSQSGNTLIITGTDTGNWESDLIETVVGNTSSGLADYVSNSHKYYLLMNGETYTDPAGHTVIFEGIKPALCYFAYARLMRMNQTTVTASGVVTKRADNSEPVEKKQIAQDILQLNSGGKTYLNRAIKYLCDKNTDEIIYDKWNAVAPAKRKGGVRMSAVDRFDSENTIIKRDPFHRE